MKMEALARKAGRRSKLEQLAGPSKRTDQIVAEDMGMSRNQVTRLCPLQSPGIPQRQGLLPPRGAVCVCPSRHEPGPDPQDPAP